MTIEHKTPKARREALAYCRRCLAVMLCCALVFGLTLRTAPRAEAAVPALAAGMWASCAVESSLAYQAFVASSGLSVDTTGICSPDIVPGTTGDVKFSSRGYDLGSMLAAQLMAETAKFSADAVSWFTELVTNFKEKGGSAPGDSFSIPANVAEEIRTWTLGQLSFVDGEVVFDDSVTTVGFVLSDVDTTELDAYTGSSVKRFSLPVSHAGSLVGWPTWNLDSDFTSTVEVGNGLEFLYKYTYEVPYEGRYKYNLRMEFNHYKGVLQYGAEALYSGAGSFNSFDKLAQSVESAKDGCGILFYSPATKRIYAGVFCASVSLVDVNSYSYFDLAETLPTVTTTIKETEATSTPVTKDLTVTVPTNAPVAQVGDYTVSIIGDVSAKDLLDPGADVPDVPIEGDATWDNVKAWLENWATHNVPDVINGAVGEAVGKAVDNVVPQAVADALQQTAPDVIGGAIDQALPGAVQGALTDALPGALDQALPQTGTKVGDQVVEEVAQDPDSLGAVFISKFPFCIPFDVIKAITLLAAQPVTPHWEIDFYAPLEGVGGFHAQGDTTIVIDFERLEFMGQVCRWTCMFGFVYALALGTKRLIWTA